MDQHEFLQRVLPSLPTPDAFGNAPVYYALGLKEVQEKVIPIQQPCSSIQAVIDHCNYCSSQNYDAYMALSSFSNVLVGRKQHNAFETRGLWADIDAGKPNGKYANTEEAIDGLYNFANETKLTPTVLVLSGMGLHAYWTFNKNIPIAQWAQLAELFYQLCIQKDFNVDPTRAREPASVLRLPGTQHKKTGRVVVAESLREDYVPQEFLDQMMQTLNTVNISPVVLAAKPKVSAGDNISNLLGMGPQPPTADAETIARNCPQILAMGMGSEPSWYAGMSILRRCYNGLDWAHKLSAFDSRYDPQGTESKFYHAPEDSPVLCSTFAMHNAELCKYCQFKDRVKTPVQLSRVASKHPVQNVVAIPKQEGVESTTTTELGTQYKRLKLTETWEYPYVPIVSNNFKVDQRGIIYIHSEKDPTAPGGYKISEDIICKTQLYYKYSVLNIVDRRPQRSHVFDAVHQNGYTEELRYIIDEDSSTLTIMKWFINAKMYPTSSVFGGMIFMSFMNAYLASVSQKAQELTTYEAMGWNTFTDPLSKEKKMGFVIGSGIITDSGLHNIAHGAIAKMWATRAFTHNGTLEDWKQVPKMYKTLGQHIGMLAVCLSFAAPFMKYGTGEAKNCLLNIWSGNSGLGKTGVLRAAASIWGNPYKSFFTKDESVVARARRLTVYNNLPAMMDELTDMSDENMSNLAFLLINGNEKSKLKSGGADFVSTGEWSTCTFATANKAFKACLAKVHGDTDATLQRVMEYECEFADYSGTEWQTYIDKCINICENNYGLAGPDFIYQILQRPDRLLTLTTQIEHWVRSNDFRSEERFMSYALGLAIKCGQWAVEFGYLDYDMKDLEQWIMDVFVPHNRKYTKEWAPNYPDSLAVYFNERVARHCVVVTAENRAVTQPDPRINNPLLDKYVVCMPQADIAMRFCQEESRIYWSKADFNTWCNKHKIAGHQMIKMLNDDGFDIAEVKMNLGKHISYCPTMRMRCYKIEIQDVTRLGIDLSDFIPVQTEVITNN